MTSDLTPGEITPCDGDVLAAQQLMRMCMPGVDWTQTIAQFLAEYCQAHWSRWEMYRVAEMQEKLDKALVAGESARADRHACANTCQRLVGVGDAAVRELVAAGANDAAARIQEMIRVALEK